MMIIAGKKLMNLQKVKMTHLFVIPVEAGINYFKYLQVSGFPL